MFKQLRNKLLIQQQYNQCVNNNATYDTMY